MRGVEAAGHADDDPLAVGHLQPLYEPLNLDIERLVAVSIEPGRVIGHVRKPVDDALQPDVVELRLVLECDAAERPLRMSQGYRGAVERQCAHALQADALDVHVRDRHPACRGETLGLA